MEYETLVARWRHDLGRRRPDLNEQERRLRAEVDGLVAVGLSPDEAFLVAVRRLGHIDDLSRAFGRRLVAAPEGEPTGWDGWPMVVCAGGAAVSVKAPALFGLTFADDGAFYGRTFALYALPWLAALLAWRRRPPRRVIAVVGALFGAGAVAATAYPVADAAQSAVLIAVHLPLALWFAVGRAHAGDGWRTSRRRMDFVRFTGEWFVAYVLLALGGAVLIGFTAGTFSAIDTDPEPVVNQWLLPCGAVAAVVVAGWLAESRQNVVENIAPALTRVFTPLFTAILVAFLLAMGRSGAGIDVGRDALILFDLLLVAVLGLLLYAISARDPLAPPGLFDKLQLALVGCALAIDVLVLLEITGRITEFGTTPNKAAALGENVVLLANLAWSAWLLLRFVRRQGPHAALERWQTAYLPVLAAWAWIVVLVLPPLFGFE